MAKNVGGSMIGCGCLLILAGLLALPLVICAGVATQGVTPETAVEDHEGGSDD